MARLAPATVSRFLNGSIDLPEKTAQRITEAAAVLNYRPNPHARSLSLGVSETVGLALPDLSNPFFGQMAAALEEAAQMAGRSVMLSSTLNSLEGELETIERLNHGYFDSLLIATNRADDGTLATAVNRNAGRIVVLDEDIPGTRVPKVFSDNRMGGYLAAQELTGAGHQHLAYIGGPERLMSTEERGRGFTEGANGAQVTVMHCHDYLPEHGRAAASRLLDTCPAITGVFFGSDTLLMGALGAIRAAGLVVPRDLSLVTFDDAGPLAQFDPAITAIRHFNDRLAIEALTLVCDCPYPDREAEPLVVRVPVELIRRASVAPPTERRSAKRGRNTLDQTGKRS